MKFMNMDAIMTRRKSFVCASLVVATAVGVMTFATTSPAIAGRQVHGGDVARILTGKAFRIECFDGTTGRGQISEHGVANVSYRRPSDQREERECRTRVGRCSLPTRSPQRQPYRSSDA